MYSSVFVVFWGSTVYATYSLILLLIMRNHLLSLLSLLRGTRILSISPFTLLSQTNQETETVNYTVRLDLINARHSM